MQPKGEESKLSPEATLQAEGTNASTCLRGTVDGKSLENVREVPLLLCPQPAPRQVLHGERFPPHLTEGKESVVAKHKKS